MPTLLFVGLGSGRTKRYLVADLLAAGHDLVLAADTLPDWARPLAAHTHEVPLGADDAVEKLVALGHAHAVAGVFTCDEAHVELAAAVARRLGLPALSRASARLCRDKHAMRQRLAEVGVPGAASVLASTLPEALAAADRIGYPVVLKPRNLGGSVGVVRADDPDTVRRVFSLTSAADMARMRPLAGVLVEEYLDGPEISVESVAAGGVTTVCAVTEKELGFPPYFEETGHITRRIRPDDRAVVEVVLAVHEALDIGWAVTHCELRLTPTGPRVVEIGARPAGDRIPQLVRLATGIDLVAAGADAALGRRVRPEPTADRVAGVRLIYTPHDGVVTRLAGDTGDLLVDFGWLASVGQRVALPPRGFLSRLAYLVAVGDTREAVARDLTQAQALLDIAVTPERAR
jgi:biotin carboxylase